MLGLKPPGHAACHAVLRAIQPNIYSCCRPSEIRLFAMQGSIIKAAVVQRVRGPAFPGTMIQHECALGERHTALCNLHQRLQVHLFAEIPPPQAICCQLDHLLRRMLQLAASEGRVKRRFRHLQAAKTKKLHSRCM